MKKPPSNTGRGLPLLLPPSCAGCVWHELEFVPDTAPTLFNHFCTRAAESDGPVRKPTCEGVTTIAPPPPAWCREPRPTLTL